MTVVEQIVNAICERLEASLKIRESYNIDNDKLFEQFNKNHSESEPTIQEWRNKNYSYSYSTPEEHSEDSQSEPQAAERRFESLDEKQNNLAIDLTRVNEGINQLLAEAKPQSGKEVEQNEDVQQLLVEAKKQSGKEVEQDEEAQQLLTEMKEAEQEKLELMENYHEETKKEIKKNAPAPFWQKVLKNLPTILLTAGVIGLFRDEIGEVVSKAYSNFKEWSRNNYPGLYDVVTTIENTVMSIYSWISKQFGANSSTNKMIEAESDKYPELKKFYQFDKTGNYTGSYGQQHTIEVADSIIANMSKRRDELNAKESLDKLEVLELERLDRIIDLLGSQKLIIKDSERYFRNIPTKRIKVPGSEELVPLFPEEHRYITPAPDWDVEPSKGVELTPLTTGSSESDHAPKAVSADVVGENEVSAVPDRTKDSGEAVNTMSFNSNVSSTLIVRDAIHTPASSIRT